MMAIGDGIALAVLNMDCSPAGTQTLISVPPSSPVRHAEARGPSLKLR